MVNIRNYKNTLIDLLIILQENSENVAKLSPC
jgi:hypothetical protein